MEPETQQLIKKNFELLPREIQDAITGGNLPEKFAKISKKYALTIEQAGDIQTETMLVMLGLESSNNLISNLSDNVEIPRETARDIAGDINTDIIGSIRESLQKLEDTNDDEKLDNEAIARANTLKGIENPTTLAQNTATPTPVNLLAEYPAIVAGQEAHTVPTPIATPVSAPATAPAPAVKSINLLDQFMSAPVTTKNPQPQTPNTTSDPYREPIA